MPKADKSSEKAVTTHQPAMPQRKPSKKALTPSSIDDFEYLPYQASLLPIHRRLRTSPTERESSNKIPLRTLDEAKDDEKALVKYVDRTSTTASTSQDVTVPFDVERYKTALAKAQNISSDLQKAVKEGERFVCDIKTLQDHRHTIVQRFNEAVVAVAVDRKRFPDAASP